MTTTPPGIPTDRTRLVAVGLAASSLTIAVLVTAHPWGDRIQSESARILVYDDLVAHRGAAWPSILVDSLCFGLVGICLALATCSLVRGRGRTAATVGGVVAVVGGLLAAMAGVAYTTLSWYLTAVPESASAAVIRAVDSNPGRVIGPEVAGFLVQTVGSLVLAFALFRARAVPRPALAAYVVVTLLLFVGLPGRADDAVQVVQMLLLAALAIPAWQAEVPAKGRVAELAL